MAAVACFAHSIPLCVRCPPALQRDALTLKVAEAIELLCNAGLQLAETSSSTAEGSDGSSGVGASGGSDTSAKQLLGTSQQASALQAAFQDAGLGELLQGQQPPTPVQPTTALRLCASSLRLATALLEWWQRPEQAAASQLALAQIATARSCAYLGCTNLIHGLGPAAVKGEGRLKCRWACVGRHVSRAFGQLCTLTWQRSSCALYRCMHMRVTL